MGRVLTHVSLAALVAAGVLAYFTKAISTTLAAVGAGYSSGVVVADRDGYFVVRVGEVALIFATDASFG
jgi:hypothetical protein